MALPSIIVTGASRGIGASIVREIIHARVARVVGVARSQDELDLLAQDVNDEGGKEEALLITVVGDITSEDVMQQVVRHATSHGSSVAAVVHNAG
jgi:NAD(P)-dependent dehydrogenase (short-subunit alcohol dehydrogenase family)